MNIFLKIMKTSRIHRTRSNGCVQSSKDMDGLFVGICNMPINLPSSLFFRLYIFLETLLAS